MLMVIAAAALAAQELEVRTLAEGAASPPARVEDVAWLAGRWIGEGLGGCAEESLSPPVGGQMMGMFRQTKADGSLWFYEFYTIAPKGDSITMRLKHFNPDLTGWEEKDGFVEFPLVAIEKGAVYFDGLTYQRSGKVLRSAVSLGENGKGEFNLRKAREGEGCPSATRP
jgi:hypothetical protein